MYNVENNCSSGTLRSRILPLLNPLLVINIVRQHSSLMRQIVRRNIISRYQGSMLGILWSVVQPLMMLFVYTFVFSVVFRLRWGGLGGATPGTFAVVMFCGIAILNIFSESMVACTGSIVSCPNYVKKVVFPLEVIPLAQVISSFILGGLWLLMLLAGILLVQKTLYWTALLLPAVLLPFFFFTCGLSFFVASLGVYVRDALQGITIIVQVLFFMTPIFYPIEAVPDKYRIYLQLNPLSFFVEEVRKVLIWGKLPDWGTWALFMIISLVIAQLGLAWFMKTKKGFADVI